MTDLSDTFEDAFNLLCGSLIAEGGAHRTVFHCALDPAYVVKVEKASGTYKNIAEWELWQAALNVPAATRWLAECKWISPNGRVLIQQRTLPVPVEDLPKRVPSWLADFKWENWGRGAAGHVMCHDYGNHRALERGLRAPLVKAEWIDA